MEPSTRSSKNQQTHTMEFLFVRPLLHAPPKSISLCSCWDNNWLLILLPRRRLRKVIIPGQAAPVLWNENLFGWFTREGKKATRKNKQTELKQSKTKQKRLFRKVARCCHATLVQTQQNDFRTSVWLLGLSSQSFISYSFGGIIHGKLRTVSLWDFLNKMFTLPDPWLVFITMAVKKSSLRHTYLSSQFEGTARHIRECTDSSKSLRSWPQGICSRDAGRKELCSSALPLLSFC